MKQKRNIAAAILLSSVMAVTVCNTAMSSFTAFAATNTITITLPSTDTATHTYEAYQVFSGDLSDGILSNIVWGANIKSAALLTLLAADDDFKTSITTSSTAADVADFLAEKTENASNTALANKFAKFVEASLNSEDPITGTFTGASNGNPSKATIDVENPGYYLIKDQDSSQTGKENGAYTKFILKVIGDASVNAKEDIPSITKKIVDGTNEVAKNTASIGDIIPYVLHSSVPDMTYYDSFCYVINDDMEEGLTFNNDVVITVGNTTLVNKAEMETGSTATNWYEVQTGTAADSHTFQIVFNDLTQYTSNDAITVKYSATLNQNAALYQDSNDNTVNLTYSNDPNFDYSGNEPSDSEPTGVTPDSKTETYTTGIQLTKIDADDSDTKLSGAVFRLSGAGLSVTKVDGDYFRLDDSANNTTPYYQLLDGTYTTTAPTTETAAKYASSQKYRKVTDTQEQGTLQYIETLVSTDTNGIASFKGLAPGTYTLTEITPPSGYNKLTAPIQITISGTAENAQTGGWTTAVDSSSATFDSTSKLFTFKIENNKGATLPATGGFGTTIFYLFGGTLILAAYVLFVTKKQMNASEEK